MKVHILVAGIVLGLVASQAHASLIFTIQQNGSDVSVVGSGAVDLATLTPATLALPYAAVRASDAWVGVGTTGTLLQRYNAPLLGPTSIGSGISFVDASTSSGDNFMMNYYSFFLPQDYVSGTQLYGTATFSNTGLADLGLTEGTYIFTWGSGANADSATIEVIPEPTTLALISVFGLGIVSIRRICIQA